VKLHVVRRVRVGAAKNRTRSKQRGKEIESTAQLARMLALV
jgi:hypothetical protein